MCLEHCLHSHDPELTLLVSSAYDGVCGRGWQVELARGRHSHVYVSNPQHDSGKGLTRTDEGLYIVIAVTFWFYPGESFGPGDILNDLTRISRVT